MSRRICIVFTACAAVLWGACSAGVPGLTSTGGDPKVAEVAAKAVQVASQIGGANGFGGMRMAGYMQAAPSNMGFNSGSDLASPNSMMTLVLHNGSTQTCTFHLAYYSSQVGTAEQSQDVTVPPGQTGTTQIPCSEIVGLGSLEDPQGVGCTLGNGQTVGNMMTVPGFLGMDFACGGTYHMYLAPDTDNLTGTGDTSALITMSEAMQTHMQSMMSGGMMGAGGMMGTSRTNP
jgi:hypothetical protein